MILDNTEDTFDYSISPPEIKSSKTSFRDCELVIMIEGSDSFEENSTTEGSAFDVSLSWSIDLIEKLFHSVEFDSFYVSMIQFSGLKQCVKRYIPGSNGIDHNSKMFHYEKFYGPSDISDDELQKVCYFVKTQKV